jgi:DNA-binding response OmpR family regulator
MAKILIVDDELEMTQFLASVLAGDGYQLETSNDARDGLRKAYTFQPDLVLLDVMMPGMNGWEMLSRFREFSDVPVLMLTAIQNMDSIVQGLDLGADDYITKPFRLQELKARIRAALRRASLPPNLESGSLQFDGGKLVIDPQAHQVWVRGESVNLTPTEYKLLFYLAQNAGRVLTYDQLLDQVWRSGYESSLTNVKVFIRQLRTKIEPEPSRPRYVLTQRGVGYYLAKS